MKRRAYSQMEVNSAKAVWGQSLGAYWGWKLCMSLSRRGQVKAKPEAAPKGLAVAESRTCWRWPCVALSPTASPFQPEQTTTSTTLHVANAELCCIHTEEIALHDIPNSCCRLPNCLYKRQFVVINMDLRVH